MTPNRGKTILFRSSQQLPRLRLGPSTRLVRCIRNYRDTRTPSGVLEGQCHQQPTQTFFVRLLKMHFFTPILDCEKSTEFN